MKRITVFTPTYNRAYCLHQLYESLVRQTNKNFCWMVIDDGSNDNTAQLIEKWIGKNKIEIIYIYQENQGMHGAHNTAYENIKTELNVCIDSDDYMPNNAIDLILNFWDKKGDDNVAGLVGLDADKSGVIIGSRIPAHISKSTLGDLYQKYKVRGDKKLVFRTEVIKRYPSYPIFEGERFVPLGYKYQLIDQDYKLLTFNEVLCIVEYLPDGSSMNILKQYRANPKGFSFSRINRMKYATNFKELFMNAIHYVSSSLFSKNKFFLSESPKKIVTFFAIPFGVLLYLYILLKLNLSK